MKTIYFALVLILGALLSANVWAARQSTGELFFQDQNGAPLAFSTVFKDVIQYVPVKYKDSSTAGFKEPDGEEDTDCWHFAGRPELKKSSIEINTGAKLSGGFCPGTLSKLELLGNKGGKITLTNPARDKPLKNMGDISETGSNTCGGYLIKTDSLPPYKLEGSTCTIKIE